MKFEFSLQIFQNLRM